MNPTEIDGRSFLICTQRSDDPRFLGEWRAWCFFAYDRSVNIYPADDPPAGVVVQESITSGTGDSEEDARQAVEDSLRRVIQSKSLEGTGFYSPPGNFIYPQERFPPDKLGGSKDQ